MKLHRYYVLSIIIVILTAISFDTSLPKFMDNALETKIEVSLEEKTSDEKLNSSVSAFVLKNIKISTGFDFSIHLVNQLYLNNIFKPPIFS